MKLRFSKMHGAGNDFVVFDAMNQAIELSTDQVRFIADRHFGVGCDQLLLVEHATRPDADFRDRIFNADGGEVEQCGNGARCFMRFVHDKKLSVESEIRVETACGIIRPRLEADGRVSVNMGEPVFDPSQIPFAAGEQALTYKIMLDDEAIEMSVLSMGNPHAVQYVDNVDIASVTTQGPRIESHPSFPNKVNAGFAQIMDRQTIRLRVFERGAGETLACGTGACAAVVAGIRRDLLDETVQVTTRGGELTIHWAGVGTPVWMTGPAENVFEGEIELG